MSASEVGLNTRQIRCPCGLPLHYSNPDHEQLVKRMVEELGPDVKVTLIDGSRSWMISRHFIALHGIKGENLAEVAKKYGFKEVTDAAEP